jgi:short-subunit dehydrogenase
MTTDYKRNWFWVDPTYAAEKIVTAIDSGKHVIYVPAFWRLAAIILKLIPEVFFVKISVLRLGKNR